MTDESEDWGAIIGSFLGGGLNKIVNKKPKEGASGGWEDEDEDEGGMPFREETPGAGWSHFTRSLTHQENPDKGFQFGGY